MDDDIYSIILDDDDDSATSRARAMAQALHSQQTMGNFWQLSGDDVLGGVGQNLGNQAQTQGEALRRALDGRQEGKLKRSMLHASDADAAAKSSKQKLDLGEGLRKEFMGNQVVKDSQVLASARAKMESAFKRPSAAGDMGLVYGIMKMFDPGSTVREGEFATAENAGGIPSQIMNLYNKVLKGERLPPAVRQDFMTQANGLYQAQLGRLKPLQGEYGRLARQGGLQESDVVLNLGLSEPGATPTVVESRQAPSGQIIDLYSDGSKRVRE